MTAVAVKPGASPTASRENARPAAVRGHRPLCPLNPRGGALLGFGAAGMEFLGAARSDGAVSGRRAEPWLRSGDAPGGGGGRGLIGSGGPSSHWGVFCEAAVWRSVAGGAQCWRAVARAGVPSAQGQGREAWEHQRAALGAGKGVRRRGHPSHGAPRLLQPARRRDSSGPSTVHPLHPAFLPPAKPRGLGGACPVGSLRPAEAPRQHLGISHEGAVPSLRAAAGSLRWAGPRLDLAPPALGGGGGAGSPGLGLLPLGPTLGLLQGVGRGTEAAPQLERGASTGSGCSPSAAAREGGGATGQQELPACPSHACPSTGPLSRKHLQGLTNSALELLGDAVLPACRPARLSETWSGISRSHPAARVGPPGLSAVLAP